MEERIIELGSLVKKGKLTWNKSAIQFNREFGCSISGEAIRKRYNRIMSKGTTAGAEICQGNEFVTQYQDNTIEAQKVVEYSKEIFGDKKKLLKYLGYNANEWEFVYVTTSTWEQHTKEQTTKQMYAVKYKIRPISPEISMDDALKAAKDVFKKHITPIELPKREKLTELDNSKLLEIPAIELHLGKMAWNGDTGQDYDKNIAQDRFYKIMEEIIHQQEYEQCGTCLLCIGNDFFNSDTVNATTTKGTPQTNDLRWKKMFIIGLELYKQLLFELRSRFNKVDVRLCSGNHDKMSSFYLYMALSCYFNNDDILKFSNDYKDVQCYVFGKNLIAFTHGDNNLKRLIKSIPVEFYKEWGSTLYRELHIGHLHKEVVVDDESGLITRRVGSPTGTDQWHYEERFIGATQKAQTFVWDKNLGLTDIKNINFINSKKKLTRRRTL